MTPNLDALGWPTDRIGEAMRTASQRARLPIREAMVAPGAQDEDLEDRVRRAAAVLGLDAEPCGCPAGDVESMLRGAPPALVRVRCAGSDRMLALVRGRRGGCVAIGPHGRAQRIPVAMLADLLCRGAGGSAEEDVSTVLAAAGVPRRRRERARRALLAERLAGTRVEGVYLLRLPAAAPLRAQLRQRGLPLRLARLLGAHLAEQLLLVASFWVLGATALAGHLDLGWLAAWGLLLATQIPLHALVVREQAAVGIETGALLERHMLAGVLKQDSVQARREGAGQTLGRVLEAQAVEEMVVGPGFAVALASTELVVGAAVLAVGAAARIELPLLAAFLVAGAILARRLLRARGAWTDERLSLTHETIERMVGHRTRLAQQPESAWHDDEDQALRRMWGAGRTMDARVVTLVRGLPRTWLVASVLAFAPSLLGGGSTVASLAAALGGALVVRRALARATDGAAGLAGALVGLRRLRPVLDAATRPDPPVSPIASAPARPFARARFTLEARRVMCSLGRASPVLRDVTLSIRAGDRLLVEGPSGAGKSTLAGVLVGLRDPDAGLVLLDGLDRATTGDAAWRARVAAVPQFHDNHLLGASLAFNLLMGRRWPPAPEDLAEAEAVCRELSLGPLLDRMPAGIQQPVGETGWQLSHGERSRVFVARALLQGADVVVLDESFAALDPATLRRAAACVSARAGATVVIAHP